jgi:hypothetical protein
MTNTEEKLADLQAAFFSVYSKVPLNIRDEIVAVIDGKPITWNVAFIEVNAVTPKAEGILQTLRGMSII